MIGTADGKELLGRCRSILEENIKMDHKGIDRVVVDWVNVIQDRGKWWAVLKMVMTIGFHKMGDIS